MVAVSGSAKDNKAHKIVRAMMMTNRQKRIGVMTGFGVVATLIALGLIYPRVIFLRQRRVCTENLRQIGLGSRMWSHDSSDDIAPSLEALNGYLTNSRCYVCPGSGHAPGPMNAIQAWTDYGFVSGGKESDPPAGVLAFCPPSHHGGKGALVLYGDLTVRWLSVPEFARITNDPVLLFGTGDRTQLDELRKRRRIINPIQ